MPISTKEKVKFQKRKEQLKALGITFDMHCDKCGHDWEAEEENPKRCPSCHTRTFDTISRMRALNIRKLRDKELEELGEAPTETKKQASSPISKPIIKPADLEIEYESEGIPLHTGFWAWLTGKKDKPKKFIPNAFIIRYEDGRFKGKYDRLEKNIGSPRRRKGLDIYYYTLHNKDGKDILRPLIPQEEIKQLPETLYRKLHKWWAYKEFIKEKMKHGFWEKLAIGTAFGFLCVMVLAIFLIVVSVGGGE